MTITNAIKKVEKHTGVKVQNNGHEYYIVKNGEELSFIQNGCSDSAICFRTRSVNDKDDFMTDYCAGVFHDNVTKAIRSINNN